MFLLFTWLTWEHHYNLHRNVFRWIKESCMYWSNWSISIFFNKLFYRIFNRIGFTILKFIVRFSIQFMKITQQYICFDKTVFIFFCGALKWNYMLHIVFIILDFIYRVIIDNSCNKSLFIENLRHILGMPFIIN